MRKLLKKSLACILTAIICVSLCVVAVPASAAAPAYSTYAVEAKAGETVDVTFTVSNFADVKGAQIKFFLPEVVASIEAVKCNAGELVPYADGEGNYEIDAEAKSIKLIALFGYEDELAAVDTLVLTATVVVAEDATAGTYDYAAPEITLATATGYVDVDADSAFGEFKVVPAIEKFDFYGSNMTLGSSLLFNFFVKQSNITDAGSYAVITKEFADGREPEVTVVPSSEWEPYSKNKYWKITFSGISAKEVNDKITCEIFDSKDNAISNPKVDGIGDYCNRLYNAPSTAQKAKVAAVDLLYFCAGAQVQFNYDLDNLATNYITEEMAALATTEATAENKQVAGQNFYGTVLAIEDKNIMKMFFKNVDTTTMYAVYSYTDFRGREQEYTVEGKDFVKYGSKYYGPAVDTLAYGDGYQLVTCTIYNADGTVHGSCVDSIESATARLIDKYPDNPFYSSLMKIVVSMRNYSLS